MLSRKLNVILESHMSKIMPINEQLNKLPLINKSDKMRTIDLSTSPKITQKKLFVYLLFMREECMIRI